MIRLHVIVEGSTEETFVTELLAPHLIERGVAAVPILIGKSGGNVSYSRLKRDAVLYMKSDPTAYCTTFVDYYGLGRGFPAKDAIGEHDSPDDKKRKLEGAVFRDIEATLGNHYDTSHFIPYVQMYEFEGLLFSDPARMAAGIGMRDLESAFRAIRNQFATPEHINDSRTTAPSKRVEALCPGYSKEFQGNLAALKIGLAAIRSACPLFSEWVARIEGLGAM
jgi:Domain of unknown function (DUF4276)